MEDRETHRPSYHRRTQQEVTIYELGNGVSSDTNSATVLISSFPAPEVWEINLLFKSLPVYGILL